MQIIDFIDEIELKEAAGRTGEVGLNGGFPLHKEGGRF